MTSLTNHIKKMNDSNPNAPYYNIPVLAYQVRVYLNVNCRFLYDVVSIYILRTQMETIVRFPFFVIANLLFARPLPTDGDMAEDHGAPEAGQLPRVWTRESPKSPLLDSAE